ncbi:MAG: hypothetical protein ABH845_03300 [Candidatus Omnitrophota bacterium]
MKKVWAKKMVSVFIITLFVMVSPNRASAGENLKAKLQKRLNVESNIQFQGQGFYDDKDMSRGIDAWSASGVAQDVGATEPQPQVSGEKREKQEKEGKSSVALSGKTCTEEARNAPAFSSYAIYIYQTNYQAELEEDVVTVKGKVVFEVFNQKGWTQLPLVKTDVGLIDVSVNKGTSFVIMQGGRYYLMVDKPGKYTLDMEFLIKASRERENGPGGFSVEVIPAPISQFEFTMPEPDVQIFVEPAIKVELKKEAKRTVAWAVMPNTSMLTVRWTKALPKEEITAVQLEPKVYLDTATYASVGEGVIRCQSRLNYSILQSELSNLRLAVPEDVSVLEVSGRDLRDWKISKGEGLQYIDVFLTFGIKGSYSLNLTYERSIGDGSVVAEVPWIRAVGAERENGYIGIATKTNVELAVSRHERVDLVDVKELPSSIWSSSANPILLAFKYHNHPFNLAIEVVKHEELPVLVAAIDLADYVALHTEEGKILTKATYQVRNNVKQFLRLVLPQNATLWSAFVAGKPVKPAKDKSGSILIPLEKSQLQGESLTQFPVEVVYLAEGSKMNFMGHLKLSLPQVDIPVSELDWSVYLPAGYTYFNFGGDVKRVRGAFRSSQRAAGGSLSRQRPVADQREDYFGKKVALQQMQANEVFDDISKRGALPIKISIPQQGRALRFSKLLVTEKESPWVRMNYTGIFKKFGGFARFLLIVIILASAAIALKKRSQRKGA